MGDVMSNISIIEWDGETFTSIAVTGTKGGVIGYLAVSLDTVTWFNADKLPDYRCSPARLNPVMLNKLIFDALRAE